MASTFYHLAHRSARESILAHGLDALLFNSEGRNITPSEAPAATYLWDNTENALLFLHKVQTWDRRHLLEDPAHKPTDWDLWRVFLPPELPIKLDPYFATEKRHEWADNNPTGTPGAWYYDGAISAHNLDLIAVFPFP